MRSRQVPSYSQNEYAVKTNEYCVCVFVINEGEKLLHQLKRMHPVCEGIADIVVADGGSTDGSTEDEKLKALGVNTLLIKTGAGKLGSQMRMAFDWALKRGYQGVICVDGNGKDGIEAIPRFVDELKRGVDHVQGSRFIPGGYHENTPRSRLIGLKLLHAPMIRLASGFHYTDTTNGFRAYSAKLLADEKIAVFRDCFTGYELHYYLAVEAAKQGFLCKEIPVSRVYPTTGKVPTKISGIKGNFNVIEKLFLSCIGYYRPDFKRSKMVKRWLHRIAIVILTIAALITMTSVYAYNRFGLVSKSIFQSWQSDSEALVKNRLRYNECGKTLWYSLKPGLLVNDGNRYPSSPGLQGSTISMIDHALKRYVPSQSRRMEHLHFLHAFLFSLVMLLIILWCFRQLGWLAAIGAFLSCIFSPWLVCAAQNLYWQMWLLFLPMTLMLWFCEYYWKDQQKLKRRSTIVFSVLLFFCLVGRFACGFEFTSTVMISLVIPLLYYAIKYRKNKWEYLALTAAVGMIALIAFAVVCGALVLQNSITQNWTLDYSWHYFQNVVGKRTGALCDVWGMLSSFLPYLPEVFDTYLGKAYLPILWTWEMRPLLYGLVLVSFYPFLTATGFPSIRKKRRLLIAWDALLWSSFLMACSWLILSKGHSTIHINIDYLIWNMPLTIFLVAFIFYVIGNLTGDLLLLLKKYFLPLQWGKCVFALLVVTAVGLAGWVTYQSNYSGVIMLKRLMLKNKPAIAAKNIYAYEDINVTAQTRKLLMLIPRKKYDGTFRLIVRGVPGQLEPYTKKGAFQLYYRFDRIKKPLPITSSQQLISFDLPYATTLDYVGVHYGDKTNPQESWLYEKKYPKRTTVNPCNVTTPLFDRGIMRPDRRIILTKRDVCPDVEGKTLEIPGSSDRKVIKVEYQPGYWVHIILDAPLPPETGYPQKYKIK